MNLRIADVVIIRNFKISTTLWCKMWFRDVEKVFCRCGVSGTALGVPFNNREIPT
jgi:hypothetical protein